MLVPRSSQTISLRPLLWLAVGREEPSLQVGTGMEKTPPVLRGSWGQDVGQKPEKPLPLGPRVTVPVLVVRGRREGGPRLWRFPCLPRGDWDLCWDLKSDRSPTCRQRVRPTCISRVALLALVLFLAPAVESSPRERRWTVRHRRNPAHARPPGPGTKLTGYIAARATNYGSSRRCACCPWRTPRPEGPHLLARIGPSRPPSWSPIPPISLRRPSSPAEILGIPHLSDRRPARGIANGWKGSRYLPRQRQTW